MNAMEISRTGLDVEWRRLQVVAENLANINTTRAEGGQPYASRRLVSGPARFAKALDAEAPQGVRVVAVERAAGAFRRVHEPNHPHADAAGFVSYPAIEHAAEMALMVRTARAYEANLVALSLAQQMYSRALELGRSQ